MHKKPNILVLMTDQQRADAMSCAGNSLLKTDAIDSIAASGIRFTNACASTPVCVASRMSFLTGHRAATTHWMDNAPLAGPIPELPTMMGLLLRAGYQTHGVGKMHFHGRNYGFQNLQTMEEGIEYRVDDDYLRYLRDVGINSRFPKGIRDLLYFQPQTSGVPVEHSASTWVADRSIDFLREHSRYRSNKPFFLWSSWIAPHPPFAPIEPYDDIYDPEDMPLPYYTNRPISDLPSSLWSSRARLDGAHRDPERLKRLRALYYGMIHHVDDGIARILATLDECNQSENTVILFTSDHGEMLGDHGLSQKNCPYESSVRIPFILRWPGKLPKGETNDIPVGLTDVLPTLVDEIGLEYPDDGISLPGDNLFNLLSRESQTTRSDYVIDYGQNSKRWISVRSPTHKYNFFSCDGGREELFNLSEDPEERTNLIHDFPDLTKSFRARVHEWEMSQGLARNNRKQGIFTVFPTPKETPDEESIRDVMVNEGPWPKRVPEDEISSLESFAEAFSRAISKEKTLSPNKLSIAIYKAKIEKLHPRDSGGESLQDTPWSESWFEA